MPLQDEERLFIDAIRELNYQASRIQAGEHPELHSLGGSTSNSEEDDGMGVGAGVVRCPQKPIGGGSDAALDMAAQAAVKAARKATKSAHKRHSPTNDVCSSVSCSTEELDNDDDDMASMEMAADDEGSAVAEGESEADLQAGNKQSKSPVGPPSSASSSSSSIAPGTCICNSNSRGVEEKDDNLADMS